MDRGSVTGGAPSDPARPGASPGSCAALAASSHFSGFATTSWWMWMNIGRYLRMQSCKLNTCTYNTCIKHDNAYANVQLKIEFLKQSCARVGLCGFV